MDLDNTVIYSWGCTSHAQQLAQQLGCGFHNLPSLHIPWHKDNALFVSAFPAELAKMDELFNYGKNIYTILVGTDVMELMRDKEEKRQIKLLERYKLICVSNQLKTELHSLGLQAEVITLVPNPIKVELKDNRKGILVYIPEAPPFKKWLFREAEIRNIILQLPEFDFYIVGGKLDMGTDNVKDLGFISPEQEIDIMGDILLNCRISRHDGFSQHIIKMAQNRIPSLVSYSEVPYTHKVSTNDDTIVKEVVDFIKNYEEDDSELQSMEMFFKDKYLVERMVERFNNFA